MTGSRTATAAPFSFSIVATAGRARAGVFMTPHGPVETPAFMPVATLATIKALDPAEVYAAGARMILANAYHLHLRPGDEVIRDLGGLHRFMGWDGPIITDSGGFQVFSLETLRTVDEDGVDFRSHIDGSRRRFTPESVMRIERNLGADVIMQFDHVVPGQSSVEVAREASDRSIRWLTRCRDAFGRLSADQPALRQALFPIVQGGIHATLRQSAAHTIASLGPWAGYGIGGLSVGESKEDTYAMVDAVDEVLPRDRPRYLMGVGFPADLLAGIQRGVDLFDCVAPTRMGRNGTAFTSAGAGRHMYVLGVHPLLARLSTAPVRRRRDARPAPSVPAQCTFLGVARPLRARGHCGREPVSRRTARQRAGRAVILPMPLHPR
jgi:queuine tRNA-ribosyltransferase